MRTSFLDGFAAGVAATGVACLRFNFAYAEAGKRSPDREPALRAVWLAAFAHAGELGGPVWAGGKSLGGRIASMMTADGDIDPRGLVFVGYPLHPPGKPERLRDAHLDRVGVPMLFLQGTADPFARWDLLTSVVDRLDGAVLHAVDGGDHSFRVRGAGRDDVGTGTALGEIAGRFLLER
jgi:predicted alpha/beta-hydrolase family hydrolase